MRARTILSLIAALTFVMFLVQSPTVAEPAKGAVASAQDRLEPLAESAWDYAKARHLLFRAGFGGTPEEVEKLHAMGLRKAVDYLVDYHQQPDVDVAMTGESKGREPPNLVKQKPEDRIAFFKGKKRQNDVQLMQEMRRWWVNKMVKSTRPLEEKLVLFWHGIFATEWRTVRNSIAMGLQNQLLREHARGNYGKLLHAIIRDPAMLRYLDNNVNVKGKPNENLAREIMELFSMGEGQGYTEIDVREGARALTGYTFDPRTLEPRFNPGQHDTGDITIFGKTGKWNGDQFVDMILEQQATPRFIAFRLYNYFAQDKPDEEMVAELAQRFKEGKFEVAPLLKTIFLSREFYSPKVMGTHYKSPAQLVVGSLRTLQIKEFNPDAMVNAMRIMNQDLFDPPNVKGWDGGEAWINTVTLFARKNFAAILVSQGPQGLPLKQLKKEPKKQAKRPKLEGKGVDFVEMLKNKKLDSPAAVVDHFTKAFLVVPLSEPRRTQLLEFLGEFPSQDRWADRKAEVNLRLGALVILIMSMPEYQLA